MRTVQGIDENMHSSLYYYNLILYNIRLLVSRVIIAIDLFSLLGVSGANSLVEQRVHDLD